VRWRLGRGENLACFPRLPGLVAELGKQLLHPGVARPQVVTVPVPVLTLPSCKQPVINPRVHLMKNCEEQLPYAIEDNYKIKQKYLNNLHWLLISTLVNTYLFEE